MQIFSHLKISYEYMQITCKFLGDIDAAICGGVNLVLDPALFFSLSKARMVSPTGQCHAFSANADGYARGEGCGIVILKKHKQVKTVTMNFFIEH